MTMPTLTLLFNKVLEIQTTAIRQEKEIKSIQIGKEEVNPSLFADFMMLYIENPKDSIKKLLEIVNEYNKVAGYKINIEQKSFVFLYTNNKLVEWEIEKRIPFTVEAKRIKYRGINLSKDVKDMYTENYKMFLKKIKDDTKKWKDILCSWTGKIKIVKMFLLH